MTDTTSLPEEFALFQRELSRLTDQRSPQGRVFPWAGVLGLTVLTLLRGYRSLSAIYERYLPVWGHPSGVVAAVAVATAAPSVSAHVVAVTAPGVGG